MALRKPSYTVHEGFRMPKGFPVAGFKSARRFTARADDILISTYPKCGTTWMQHIVWLILHRGEALGAHQRMTDVIPHLEEVGCEVVENLPAPRTIKTHLPFAMVPLHPRARVIYVMRNPFDCAVSFYHHTRGFVRHYDFAEGTFAEYFECFLAGEVDFGDYFENVLSWFRQRQQPNVLATTYEQMIADPRAAVIAVGEFLGAECRAAVHDEAILSRIVDHSSFQSMSRDQLRWSSQRPEGMPAFVRKGQVGDWANHFSPDQARRLLARIRRIDGASELCAQWPETMHAAAAYASSG